VADSIIPPPNVRVQVLRQACEGESEMSNTQEEHDKRVEQGDVEASIQAARQSAQPMSEETKEAAFNPDQKLTTEEMRARVDQFLGAQDYESLRMQYNMMRSKVFPHESLGIDASNLPYLISSTSAKVQEMERNEGRLPTNRPTIARFGLDPVTNEERMINPGEKINDQGLIEMVDPRYAEESAERMKNVSEASARQSMRRSTAFKTLAAVLLNPVKDAMGVDIVYLDDEQFKNLREEYYEAKKAGVSQSLMDFIPLSDYAGKLWPEGKAPVRPKLSNECGWFQMGSNESSNLRGKIACLKSSTTTPEQLIQVQVPRAPEVEPPSQLVDSSGNPLQQSKPSPSPDQTAQLSPSPYQPPQPSVPSLDLPPPPPFVKR
jgi:hypothetical protein